jgi:threonine dehydrogenase-like Zn-dependent dehydrogenase
MYSESLQRHGHNLEPSLLVNSIHCHGGQLIEQGQSKWVIDPALNAYLWETMLYFIGMSGGREIMKHGMDSYGWIKRSRSSPRYIIVSNVDLLFRLGDNTMSLLNDDHATKIQSGSNRAAAPIREIQFIAPYNVTTVDRNCPIIGPNQVEIESLCSLISSGTELKVFKGMFESAALDVNIKGMSNEFMEYPLSYGYSLVGRVKSCGVDVNDADKLVGKLVFVFAPHASKVIADRDAIQLVPDGIEAEDAIFMPSVETALSLVHDANVRVGENVAVYGQGLIGLLVTSILSMQTMSQLGSVTAFDTIGDRLAVSSKMGATNALHPNSASIVGPFDVSIEVSGNHRALQSAIDTTSNNGRIIVGSWYGNSDVTLKLGIDFHRSHKTIQTSQVSNIPCGLSGLWSKERRFALTWDIVKAIRPSRLISMRLSLNDAQQAYELLDDGREIAISFKY